jgi:hypothetical protein
MKKQTYMIAIVIMLLILAGLSSTNAQTSGTELTANIPFAFRVGDKSFPAGKYTVHCTNASSDRKILQLRSKDGRFNVLLQTISTIGQARDDARLVFNRYGDWYYFSQAWLAGDSIGMQATKSRGEKASAKQLASIKRATEIVSLTSPRKR